MAREMGTTFIESEKQLGRQEGRREERREVVRGLLTHRFSVIDEELETIIEPLTELSAAEFGRLILPLSTLLREELLARFGQGTQL